MIVKAMYHKPKLNGYGGQAYTFLTDLPLHPGDKVLVPGGDGTEKMPSSQRWTCRRAPLTRRGRTG